MTQETQNKKPAFKSLKSTERDVLFAFYEKWNGNVQAMVRDQKCPLHSSYQIRYYRDLYGFKEQLGEIRRKQAAKVMEMLKDSKVEALKRAMELIQPKQRMLTVPLTGEPLLDKDNQPIFVDVPPSYKEIMAAWEIIKVELGEPTQISRGDVTSGGKPINSNVITFSNFKDKENGADGK